MPIRPPIGVERTRKRRTAPLCNFALPWASSRFAKPIPKRHGYTNTIAQFVFNPCPSVASHFAAPIGGRIGIRPSLGLTRSQSEAKPIPDGPQGRGYSTTPPLHAAMIGDDKKAPEKQSSRGFRPRLLAILNLTFRFSAVRCCHSRCSPA